MREMPDGWKIKDLQDLADIDPSILRENTARDFNFHYIDIASVTEGRIDVPSTTIAFRDSPSRARKVLQRGDVLMSTVRPNLKAFAYFDSPFIDCVASTGFAILRAKREVDSRFLLYLILSESVMRQIEAYVVGSNYPAINSTAVSQLKVFTPPFPEQTKIAEVLSTVDRAIEQTEGLIAKQQHIKTGLMQDLLTRGIDEHGNLRTEATHKFKDSPLGRIPVEWECDPLRDYLSYLSYGFTNPMPTVSDGPYMVTAANIYNGKIQYDGCRRTTQNAYKHLLTNKSRPEIGDILITKDGTLGRVAIVDRSPLCINQSVAVLRTRDDVDNEYLKLLLESSAYQERIIADAGGSTIKHIYISKIDKMLIALPKSTAEQNVIKENLLSLFEEIYQTGSQLDKLHSLKTALMQDLLTGKRRITPLLETNN